MKINICLKVENLVAASFCCLLPILKQLYFVEQSTGSWVTPVICARRTSAEPCIGNFLILIPDEMFLSPALAKLLQQAQVQM